MYTFTSVNNKCTLFGKPIGVGKDQVLEYQVDFRPVGSMGTFTTDDEELAKKLRERPEFGRRFMEIGVKAPENPNIVDGIRSSETSARLGRTEYDPKKYIEFGVLQATLLKSDGTYRKDASEENKLKYEALQQELGELE